MKAKITGLILFFTLFALAGYIREYLFVHINIIMFSKYYKHPPDPPLQGFILYFERFSYDALYYLKYGFTLLFTIINFLLGYFALRQITRSNEILRVLVWAYLILFAGAGVSLLFGYFGFNRLQDDEYTLSRWLMGIAQSPIICLILLASSELIQKQRHHE